MNYLKNELSLFFTALMFYTRVPCPKWVGFREEYLVLSVRYLPLVGWLVGAVTAGMMVLANLMFPLSLSIALAMVAGLFLTGAFHEDGLADVCDGFGGGWTKEKILTIMKDSRLGTYGAAALLMTLFIKFLCLRALFGMTLPEGWGRGWFFFLVLVTGNGVSRLMAITTIVTHDYVREDAMSKAKPVVKGGLTGRSKTLWLAVALGVIPLFGFFSFYVWLVLIPMYLTKAGMARFFNKWIGGYTGDCLGAIQQITELVFYLGMIALWKFI